MSPDILDEDLVEYGFIYKNINGISGAGAKWAIVPLSSSHL